MAQSQLSIPPQNAEPIDGLTAFLQAQDPGKSGLFNKLWWLFFNQVVNQLSTATTTSSDTGVTFYGDTVTY